VKIHRWISSNKKKWVRRAENIKKKKNLVGLKIAANNKLNEPYSAAPTMTAAAMGRAMDVRVQTARQHERIKHEKKHGKKCGVAKKLHFSQGLLIALGSQNKKRKKTREARMTGSLFARAFPRGHFRRSIDFWMGNCWGYRANRSVMSNQFTAQLYTFFPFQT
jgi:hypothetical protein